MENQSLLERIFIYGVVGVTILIFATLTRYVSITIGSDHFTANVIFFVFIILGIALYSMIQIVLIAVLNLFSKNKIINKEAGENKKMEKIADEEQEFSKIYDKKNKENLALKKKKLEIAIQYTKEEFASYATREDLNNLCENIQLYSEKGNLENIKPVKVNELKALDIYHFGWNIWKHFNKVTNQTKLADFIKNVFEDLFQDIEAETIKKNLTKDEKQGSIKIKREGLF
ncbi:hypothetical protein H0I29_11260 [Polaribacter sp. R2A056_3_33]|jgi:hypothetical protein|uniref:hypothetical protein n=1 Tax=Polaribacter sp. R2A056_3_33 TaxID=2745563 RepID=UPI001C4E37C5|nr:hypothetical protein [Polaribacter sp. R2A056_3_33]QXP69209.1 hypothetical protein H0I29_11260 [Polaribacter sp. R2A056_3_33]